METRKIIKELKANGWTLRSVRGSHHTFTHPDHDQIVTVPHPKKQLPIGTLKSIERASGLKLR